MPNDGGKVWFWPMATYGPIGAVWIGIDLAKCTSIIFESGRKPNPNAMNMHRDKLCELLAVERHLKDLQSKLEMHGAFVLNGADSPLIT